MEATEAVRKLAGSISAESGLTPRRSFSRNIFRQDGERLNVLALSCEAGDTESQHLKEVGKQPETWKGGETHLIQPPVCSHGDEVSKFFFQDLPSLNRSES